MNILSIENKFKVLDEKEKKIREYFDPKLSKGKKHHYIIDIRADFQYDTLLYGLGEFWNKDSEKEFQEFEKMPEEMPQVLSITPKASKVMEKRKKSPVLAKRKNIELLNLQNPLTKDHYKGIFSDTKVLNHDYLYKKPITNFGKSGWKTAAVGERSVSNKAARVDIMYSSRIKDCTDELKEKIEKNKCESPHRLNRGEIVSLTKEEFKNYLEEFKQLVFTGKEPQKFELDLASLRKEIPVIEKSDNKPKLFQIVFQKNPIVVVRSANSQVSVSFTDVISKDFTTKNFNSLTTEQEIVYNNGVGWFDLNILFGKLISGHTFRVLIQGEKENLDYYISLQDYSEEQEKIVRKQIIDYKLFVFEAIKEKSKTKVVAPISLQVINDKIQHLKPYKTILPKINSRSKPLPNKKRDYSNPLTSALFSYKQNTESFHPQAYPANLTIFEAHDFIEENYTLPPKAKEFEQRPRLQLSVNGFGLNNSFLNI